MDPKQFQAAMTRKTNVAAALATRFPLLLAACGFPEAQGGGVDYYGVPLAKKVFAEIAERPQETAALLFLDALAEAAFHAAGQPDAARAAGVPPAFIINTYNIITTPSANISHRHPQVILGLCDQWTADGITGLSELTDAYFVALDAKMRAAGNLQGVRSVLQRLLGDPDLEPVNFKCVGCTIPQEVPGAYFEGLRNAALHL